MADFSRMLHVPQHGPASAAKAAKDMGTERVCQQVTNPHQAIEQYTLGDGIATFVKSSRHVAHGALCRVQSSGRVVRQKVKAFLKPKLHPILLDRSIVFATESHFQRDATEF
jgi:hypothetical protein